MRLIVKWEGSSTGSSSLVRHVSCLELYPRVKELTGFSFSIVPDSLFSFNAATSPLWRWRTTASSELQTWAHRAYPNANIPAALSDDCSVPGMQHRWGFDLSTGARTTGITALCFYSNVWFETAPVLCLEPRDSLLFRGLLADGTDVDVLPGRGCIRIWKVVLRTLAPCLWKVFAVCLDRRRRDWAGKPPPLHSKVQGGTEWWRLLINWQIYDFSQCPRGCRCGEEFWHVMLLRHPQLPSQMFSMR